MKNFKLYDKDRISSLISFRKNETKLGEKIQFTDSFEQLTSSSAEFVVFGVPEDIGVRANYGKPGTVTAWGSFLPAFLNLQQNQFNQAENCLLLGEVDCENWMKKAESFDLNGPNYYKKLGGLVSEIDATVSKIVNIIVAAGKIPIIIGGGHNNAYGNIKGTSSAVKKPVNILNIDAHTDLRNSDYRHSGNGFQYALQEGFLGNYSIFGLHENYTPKNIFENMESSNSIQFFLFEELLALSLSEKMKELEKSVTFLDQRFGLEIDCDAIANFDSSAKSPSGFSMDETRLFIRKLSKHRPHYLHLCEASAKENPLIGKALAYFVSDFIN